MHEQRVLSVGTFVEGVVENAEVEDLLPSKLLAGELDRIVRESEVRLEDEIKIGVSFVDQAQSWAKSQSVELPKHWKVKLARRVKERMLQGGIDEFDAVRERWSRLFDAFEA